MDIALYVGGASHVEGVSDILKLSSNENPYGPSPKAQEAFLATAGTLHRYPGTDHMGLRAALGDVHGLDPERIICGVGSDEILAFLCQAYAGPGDEVIHTEHGFAIYRIAALAAGATPVEVREAERVTDVDAILEAVTPATRLVFIANPNNPTATMIDLNELTRLADGLPKEVILVLDGAYAEFAEGYDGGASLVESRPNIVMTRTFSKLYGLGGLRVGFGYAPKDVIDVLNRIRGPFNLGASQLEAAEAAVRDQSFTDHCLAENARLRVWLREQLAALGIPSDPSHANFVLAQFTSEAEANACDAFLRAHGVIIRKVAGYKLPHCLRMTVGDQAGCERLIATLAEFRKATA